MPNMKDYQLYKFAIKQLIEGKPANRIPDLKQELITKLAISYDWFSKIINAKVDSAIKLDHIQLSIVADVLDCSIDALITPQCRTAIRKDIQQKLVAQAA